MTQILKAWTEKNMWWITLAGLTLSFLGCVAGVIPFLGWLFPNIVTPMLVKQLFFTTFTVIQQYGVQVALGGWILRLKYQLKKQKDAGQGHPDDKAS